MEGFLIHQGVSLSEMYVEIYKLLLRNPKGFRIDYCMRK